MKMPQARITSSPGGCKLASTAEVVDEVVVDPGPNDIEGGVVICQGNQSAGEPSSVGSANNSRACWWYCQEEADEY